MAKYKFAVDPSLTKEIEEFFKKNSGSENKLVEIKSNNISATIKFITDDEKELFKYHKLLLNLHQIKSSYLKSDINEPKIVVTIKGAVNRGFYYNYVLGNLFCQILNDKKIHFSIAKITKTAFHFLDTTPVWITESDYKKVVKIISNSPLRMYHVEILYRDILADT